MNDELLISYLLDETSANERHQVEEWLKADPENQRHFEKFKLIWDASSLMGTKLNVDAHASLKRFKAKVKGKNITQATIKYLWLKAAAIITIVGIGAWLIVQQISMTGKHQIEMVTAKSEIKTDTLADGSIITLNKNSSLLHPEKFAGNSRTVALKGGEAFFKIAPDKTKPFIIAVNGATVKVVGTSFNIKTVNTTTEVIVETGVVEVTRDGRSILLHPGEKTVVTPGIHELTRQQTPDLLYQYYRTNKFVADDTPLWRMVQVLNEAYDSRIIIENKALANLPLNTTFDNESLDDILTIITKTFHITATKKGDQIILK